MANQDDTIILIVDSFDRESTHGEDEEEAFVFRTRGQSEDEPLKLELTVNKTNSDDDHTDETCENSSRSSAQSHDEELGRVSTSTGNENKVGSSSSSSTWPQWVHDLMWLTICFLGIMTSFVAYGILLEYATSGDRRLHERTFHYCEPDTKQDLTPFFSSHTYIHSSLYSFLSLCYFSPWINHCLDW